MTPPYGPQPWSECLQCRVMLILAEIGVCQQALIKSVRHGCWSCCQAPVMPGLISAWYQLGLTRCTLLQEPAKAPGEEDDGGLSPQQRGYLYRLDEMREKWCDKVCRSPCLPACIRAQRCTKQTIPLIWSRVQAGKGTDSAHEQSASTQSLLAAPQVQPGQS